jgi:Ca2+-binding RTX toxin-like protein
MKFRNTTTIAAAALAMLALPCTASAAVWADGWGMSTAFTMPAGAPDTMWGHDGNDQLHGNDFGDAVNGEAGNDDLFGDAGNDTVRGGIGGDYVHGDNGDDKVYGEDGADFVYGGPGFDELFGGMGVDSLFGGDQDDILRSDEPDLAIDTLDCGPGNDTAYVHGEDVVAASCETVVIVP